MAGAHRLGASKQGLAASIIGGMIGAVLLTPFLYGLGTFLGLFIGSFAGVWTVEIIRQQKLKAAFRAATGAIMGRAAGTMVKGVLTIGMIVMTLITIYS